jgi:hypothetical protein
MIRKGQLKQISVMIAGEKRVVRPSILPAARNGDVIAPDWEAKGLMPAAAAGFEMEELVGERAQDAGFLGVGQDG